MNNNRTQLVKYIVGMLEEESVTLARQMLNDSYDPLELLAHCREAMDQVGIKFENGEYFLPELMMAGDILNQISSLAKPLIQNSDSLSTQSTHGKVLIGTVHGDLHDIGKDIVTFMLEISGFEVIDLGIDVPIINFINAIKEHKPSVVALSGFLTLAFDSMKKTIEAIEEAELRDELKIMIGGGQIDDSIKTHTGADAFGLNAMDAVKLCKHWMEVAA